jgi:hypothetical protein
MTTGSPDVDAAVPEAAAGAVPDPASDGRPRPATPAGPADATDPADGASRSLRSQLEEAHGLPLEQRTVAFETLLEELARQLDQLPRG